MANKLDKSNKSSQVKNLELQLNQKNQIADIYDQAAGKVSETIRILDVKQKARGFGYQLTIDSQEQLKEQLTESASFLRGSFRDVAERNTALSVNNQALEIQAETREIMAGVSFIESKVLRAAQEETNAYIVWAQFQKRWPLADGTLSTYSGQVWNISTLFKRDVESVIFEGLARQRSVDIIAKDLEIYVADGKTSLAQRYGNLDQSPKKIGETDAEYKKRVSTFKKRIPNNIDYRALRLARSIVQSANQDSQMIQAETTPSVEAFKWNLSPSHRTYSVCEDIVALNPHTMDSFQWAMAPHPNCMSFITYILIPAAQLVKDLKTWERAPGGGETKYLDEWKSKYYDPVERGESITFPKLIERASTNDTKGAGPDVVL